MGNNALKFIYDTFRPSTVITIADEYGDIIYNGSVRGLNVASVVLDDEHMLANSIVTSVELGNGRDEDVIIEIETKTKKTTGFYR